jgi:hypothetical protein
MEGMINWGYSASKFSRCRSSPPGPPDCLGVFIFGASSSLTSSFKSPRISHHDIAFFLPKTSRHLWCRCICNGRRVFSRRACMHACCMPLRTAFINNHSIISLHSCYLFARAPFQRPDRGRAEAAARCQKSVTSGQKNCTHVKDGQQTRLNSGTST